MKTLRFCGARLLVALLLTLVAYNASGSSGSDAGATWTLRVPGINDFSSVTYGNGLFVVVGGSPDSSTILTSQDGVDWMRRSLGDDPLNSVAYGNGLFVAVGDGSTIFTSPNGVNWTQRTSGTSNRPLRGGGLVRHHPHLPLNRRSPRPYPAPSPVGRGTLPKARREWARRQTGPVCGLWL